MAEAAAARFCEALLLYPRGAILLDWDRMLADFEKEVSLS